MNDVDPRLKWRQLPGRIQPEEMVLDVASSDYDSSVAADENAAQREARWLLERGGGLGL
ncbi:MAG TPA: hypothetical protein VIQ30_22245 [Pseudonocardia sp.]|jgi:hypothetical protein